MQVLKSPDFRLPYAAYPHNCKRVYQKEARVLTVTEVI